MAKTKSRSKPRTAARRSAARRRRGFGAWQRLALAGVVGLIMLMGLRSVLMGAADSTCTVSSTLVNSCRPWLGATSANYGVTGFANEIANHESRIGRQLDVVHDYRTPGQTLSSDDISLAKRDNTYLMLNWKPASNWGDAGGGDSTVNSQIDAMANSIKGLGSKKIFLAIFHEPENDVSPGGSPSCGSSISYKGSAGTTAQYVAMWHNVESRFAADGVSNVVWVMNYMGFSTWDCMVDDLWPGNSYVDWVVWDPYISNGSDFNGTISRFYNVLTNKSDSSHDYLSKTWGINEWGDWNSSQSDVYSDYAQAKAALDNNTYPKIKLWDDYDATGTHDARVGYSLSGVADPTEQADYNKFADDPRFTDAFYTPAPPPPPPADTTPPSVNITSPNDGDSLAGTVTVSGAASDNVGVTKVELAVDGSTVGSDSSSPYSFSLDTTGYSDGSHSLSLKAYDAAGNTKADSINVTFNNQPADGSGGGSGSGSGGSSGGSGGGTTTTSPGPGVTTTSTPGGGTTTVISTKAGSSSAPVPVKGTIVIAPSKKGAAIKLIVDGQKQAGNTVDTSKLTNGTHVLTIDENGKVVKRTISVHNPWPTALGNDIAAHPVAYATGSSTGLVVLLGVAYLFRRKISFWLLRHLHMQSLSRFGLARLIRLGIK